MAAKRKVAPIMARALRDELPAVEAAQKIKRLVPDPEMLQKLFEFWMRATKTTPEQEAEQWHDIERRQKELARPKQWLAATQAVSNGLTTLTEGAAAGEPEATEQLVKAAIQAAVFVAMAEKKHPDCSDQGTAETHRLKFGRRNRGGNLHGNAGFFSA